MASTRESVRSDPGTWVTEVSGHMVTLERDLAARGGSRCSDALARDQPCE